MNTTLKGQTFVLTGTLPTLSRDAARSLIEAAGGVVEQTVSSTTQWLVAGAEAGSKVIKAVALGVPVIDETALLSRLRRGGSVATPYPTLLKAAVLNANLILDILDEGDHATRCDIDRLCAVEGYADDASIDLALQQLILGGLIVKGTARGLTTYTRSPA